MPQPQGQNPRVEGRRGVGGAGISLGSRGSCLCPVGAAEVQTAVHCLCRWLPAPAPSAAFDPRLALCPSLRLCFLSVPIASPTRLCFPRENPTRADPAGQWRLRNLSRVGCLGPGVSENLGQGPAVCVCVLPYTLGGGSLPLEHACVCDSFFYFWTWKYSRSSVGP